MPVRDREELQFDGLFGFSVAVVVLVVMRLDGSGECSERCR